MFKNTDELQVIPWKNVEEQAREVNPFLVDAISTLKGSRHLNVVKIKYPYGESIIDKGQFNINKCGRIVPYCSETDTTLSKLFDYNWKTIPFGMVLKNSAESHINHSSHIVPFMLQPPGKTFSLLTVFENENFNNFISGLYSTKSGCRSLLMLSKLTHSESNQRLEQRYGITQNLFPEDYSEHWGLFKELFDSESNITPWNSELIFFTKDFVNDRHATLELRHSLLKNIWEFDSFRRNQFTHQFIWSLFYAKHITASQKKSPLIINTVNHLIELAMGQVPGFAPATNDIPGPINYLTDVFLNDYRLRNQRPIFMRLEHYSNNQPVYYSLHKHTFFNEFPEKIQKKTGEKIQLSHNRSTVTDLLTIKEILTNYIDFIINDKFEHSLKNTALYQRLQNVKFDFIHPNSTSNDIIHPDSLDDVDARFSAIKRDKYSKLNLPFPKQSTFFCGCIRIMPTSH